MDRHPSYRSDHYSGKRIPREKRMSRPPSLAAVWRNRRGRLAVLTSAAAVVLVAAFMAVVPAASAATLFSDDFQDGNATGWSKSGGDWSVVTDGTLAFRQSK